MSRKVCIFAPENLKEAIRLLSQQNRVIAHVQQESAALKGQRTDLLDCLRARDSEIADLQRKNAEMAGEILRLELQKVTAEKPIPLTTHKGWQGSATSMFLSGVDWTLKHSGSWGFKRALALVRATVEAQRSEALHHGQE